MSDEFHPVSSLFPLLETAELATLAADIRANGLREPIWRHRDGRIIDGRNRWLACQEAGVTCHAHTWNGEDRDLVSFVVSLNLHRRHLTPSQRAAIASEIANMARTNHRQGRKVEVEISTSTSGTPPAVSLQEAADLMGVDRTSVTRAKRIKREAPDLHEKMKRGELSGHAAEVERKKRAAAGEASRQVKPPPSRGKKRAKVDPIGRPAFLNDFYLWLTRGPEVLDACPEPHDLAATAARCRVFLDPAKLRRVAEFLSSVAEGVEADRAA